MGHLKRKVVLLGGGNACNASLQNDGVSAFRGLEQPGQEVGLGDKMPKICPVVLLKEW